MQIQDDIFTFTIHWLIECDFDGFALISGVEFGMLVDCALEIEETGTYVMVCDT